MAVNPDRDKNLTDFGRATLTDRYLLPGESFQDLFWRVASYYSNDEGHAQRLYDYMSKLWFMPATPILSNGGTKRGLPISCFLSEASDDMEGIVTNWTENIWLACRGGGIGAYWGNVRSSGERIGQVGESAGIMPFIKVQDSFTLAISQGSLRRGSAAVYLPVWHPEIEEFIEVRRPTGGDPNRRSLNLHHGVVVDDKFMKAVEEDSEYELRAIKDGSIVRTIKARDLWIRILTARIETGEPYILWTDTVNAAMPPHQKKLGLKVKTSNLCSEITLPTGLDHVGNNRTAVCCLSSLNVELYDEWKNDNDFILDVMYFLDNVLQDFINNAPDTHSRAVYSATRERSVGLGVMGLHSYYQSKLIAWESEAAKQINLDVFEHIKTQVDISNMFIGMQRGSCPDAIDAKWTEPKRFSSTMAIAPTASISVICGGASPGVEPSAANFYNHKTLSGTFAVKNKYLATVLDRYNKNDDETWSSIANHEGSVQQLDFLSEDEKAAFRTAMEIDQHKIVEYAGDRAPLIDQAQSVNLFLPADVHKRVLHNLHMEAWKQGLKSLYYCRSRSIKRAEKPSQKVERVAIHECKDGFCELPVKQPEYEECLACQ